MRVLFAGPSLHGKSRSFPGIETRPPASHGDLQSAVLEGASVIGLVDARFEDVATVWHKEILSALSEGITVLGAASMGALRAAECREFGMMPVGEIALRYASGELDDDAAVAQLHAPEELDFRPLTEALVDCEATVAAFLRTHEISEAEAEALLEASRRLFFKERTWAAILACADMPPARTLELLDGMRTRRVSIKRRDALLLVEVMGRLPMNRSGHRPKWTLARTGTWKRLSSES